MYVLFLSVIAGGPVLAHGPPVADHWCTATGEMLCEHGLWLS